MMTYLSEFFKFFFLQGINYFLLTLSMRYVAAGDIRKTLVTDAFIAAFGFFIIRLIAETPSTAAAFAGYLPGGMLGTYFGMCLTSTSSKKELKNG